MTDKTQAKPQYTSKVWTKPETQKAIKGLRQAGFTVSKINGGYVCSDRGIELFKAMNGQTSYLVRFLKGLFVPVV